MTNPRAPLAQLFHWYIARMLKRHTGAGFAEHLRPHRLAVAERLFAETTSSVKEIGRSGWLSPESIESRLSRDVRRGTDGVPRGADGFARRVERLVRGFGGGEACGAKS